MLKEKSETLVGNARYEGYSVDLVEEISKILHFNYTIKLVEDGKYGSFDKDTGKWNGMIGELQAQKADLVVADITITYEREQGVDFTMPFMNLGVTILYKKPTKKDPNLFSFLSPLSFDVWIYIITAYLAVSLLLFFLSRLSPYERSLRSGETYYVTDSAGLRLARWENHYLHTNTDSSDFDLISNSSEKLGWWVVVCRQTQLLLELKLGICMSLSIKVKVCGETENIKNINEPNLALSLISHSDLFDGNFEPFNLWFIIL